MLNSFVNPFAVQTPESIPAADVISLFVDVFSDFYNVRSVGHTFLNGPRGSGKSMMFRYLEPDCQKLANNSSLTELPFFGVYVPIKNTEIKLTEFNRLSRKHAEIVLNEHFLVVYVAVKFFAALLKAGVGEERLVEPLSFTEYYSGLFRTRLRSSGWVEQPPDLREDATLEDTLKAFRDLFTGYYLSVIGYLKSLAFDDSPRPYSGPLLGYLDFMLPVIADIKALGILPAGPVFLLVDDADNLNVMQTRVLNGWVSSRTSDQVSLKISTQLKYKTFLTATSDAIASPHDFNEVNISSVYTSAKNKYLSRVRQIVTRRLEKCGVASEPEQFFPPNRRQEASISRIEEEIRLRWHEQGRGNRENDDITRYARPNYIRGLKGKSKSGSTYSYAGFEQLVHISSGVVRYFLEAASAMYGEMKARDPGESVRSIVPLVQNRVVRDQARQFYFAEFDKLELEASEDAEELSKVKKLRNLIQSLGGLFHAILVSDLSERRVFSIALTDEDDKEVLQILKAGVQHGYLHESSIGNKEGTGRVRLFILSRRLAPLFTLDPTSFAGYKFITTASLRKAIETPAAFLRQRAADLENGEAELPLFETWGEDHAS